jgi:ABC-2 type transport system ATP-binding protein
MSPEPQDAVVAASRVRRTFTGDVGIHQLDLEIAPGTIFGFIGPSGSGKTTAVRLLTGVLTAESGTLSVMGVDPSTFTREQRARLGYLPQLPVLYPELTLWENLSFSASLFGMAWRHRRRRMDEALDLVDLMEARNRRFKDASGGMQRRLSLAATLVHDPELLFLDEPTAGVDPILRRKFWDHFATLRDAGRTLLVTTQYVGEAAYCDLVGVLAEGRILTVDTPDGLRRQAMGGEVVDVKAQQALTATQAESLARAADAHRIDTMSGDTIRLVVDDAGDAIPKLTGWATQNDLDLQSVEQYQPSFDDVFVDLVTALSPSDPSEAAASHD